MGALRLPFLLPDSLPFKLVVRFLVVRVLLRSLAACPDDVCPTLVVSFRCRPLRLFPLGQEEGLPCSLGVPAYSDAKFSDPARPLAPRLWRCSGFVPVGSGYPNPLRVQGRRGMSSFSGLNSSASSSLPTLRAALSVNARDQAQTALRLRKARFQWRGCTPYCPGFGPGWDSSEAFPL